MILVETPSSISFLRGIFSQQFFSVTGLLVCAGPSLSFYDLSVPTYEKAIVFLSVKLSSPESVSI